LVRVYWLMVSSTRDNTACAIQRLHLILSTKILPHKKSISRPVAPLFFIGVLANAFR
jgi:hypothetical protein